MKKMQLIPRLLFTGFLTMLLASGTDSSAQIAKTSIDEMTDVSTSVVHGRTTSVRSYWTEDQRYIMTDVTLDVESSLKGSASGRTVVTIPGGRVGSTLYEVSDMPVFVEGEEVVVFVWRGSNGVSTVTGGILGKLTVFDDKENNSRMVMGAGQLLDPDKTSNRVGDTLSDSKTQVRISLDDFKRKIVALGEK